MQGRDRIKTGPMRPGIRFAILSPVARTPLPFLVGGSVHLVSISESLRPADPLNTIRPMDVQRSLNAMHEAGIAVSTLKDGLVQMRDCMEYALANQLIRTNPCIVIEIPWAVPKSEEEIALMNDLAAREILRTAPVPEDVKICKDASDLENVAFL